jgi:hypothetical protein
MAKQIIRIGPAGWSYKDWEGWFIRRNRGSRLTRSNILRGFSIQSKLTAAFIDRQRFDDEIVGQSRRGK